MAQYVLYKLAPPEGRFVGFESIEAADDDAALVIARKYRGVESLELWCGARLVARIPAVDRD